MSARRDRMQHLMHPLRRRLLSVALTVWAIAPFWALVGNYGLLAVMMIVRGTGHATSRFASSEATEWALARGLWTRRDLARWTVIELAWRVLNCVLAACVIPPLADALGWSDIMYRRTALPWVLSTMSLVLVVGALLVHLQGSTSAPRWIAGMRSWHTRLSWRMCLDFLQLALVGAALAAPAAFASYALRSPWPLAVCAALLMLPLYLFIAEIEPIARDSRAGRGDERRATRHSHSFSPLTALVWRALDWRVKLLFALEVASAVVLFALGYRTHGQDEAASLAVVTTAAVFFGTGFVLQFALAFGAFHWRSHGPTAEYLASLGLECARLRRIELVAGPVLWLLVGSLMVLTLHWSPLHATAPIALFATNHRRWGRVRVHRMLFPFVLIGIALPIITAIVFTPFRTLNLPKVTFYALLAFAAWQWIVAWLETRNKLRLRERELSLGA